MKLCVKAVTTHHVAEVEDAVANKMNQVEVRVPLPIPYLQILAIGEIGRLPCSHAACL